MAKPSLFQRVSAAAAAFGRGVGASARFAGTAFQGAEKRSGGMFNWRPQLASPDREFLHDRAGIVSRSRDLARNNTVVASAARRRVSSAVGNGWRLSARIDGQALGFNEEQTVALNRAIERLFQQFAESHTFEADAQRQLTLGGLLRTAARGWFIDGEIFGHVQWAPRESASSWATRLELVDPDRITNPNNAQDQDLFRAGVELHAATRAPIAYHVRCRHPDDVGISAEMPHWKRITRWTPWGRPQFLHVFDRERPGQTRGVTQLVAALKTLKSLDRFGEATVESAILNALLLGAVKSNGGPDAVSESFAVEELTSFEDKRSDVYGGRTIDLTQGVTLPVLPLGDELQMFTGSKDVNSFEAFSRTIIRRVAASLGCTYEEVAMDYSTTNYSSARAAMIHAWQETVALQTLLKDQLVQPFYVAWLEEAIETERVTLPESAPDFWENMAAYTRCRWIMPGRGYIDATKEIQATTMEQEAMLSTLEDGCAEQGRDWREVLEQRRRELDEMLRLGIDPVAGVIAAAAAAPQITAAPDQRPEPAVA